MKIKLLLSILILILFYHQGVGQTQTYANKKNTFEFSIGYNSGALKNLEIAPVSRYDYNGLAYKLGYEHTSKNQNLFAIRLDYLKSELETDILPILNLDYAKIGLNVSYLKQVYNEDKFSIYVGLQSRSDVSIYSKRNNDRSIINQSFGAASQLSYLINEKHALFSKLTIPLALFRVTHASSGIYSLNRYQSILWNVGYKYTLSNSFYIKASYDFNYDKLQIQNTFRELQYQFNIGLNYKF